MDEWEGWIERLMDELMDGWIDRCRGHITVLRACLAYMTLCSLKKQIKSKPLVHRHTYPSPEKNSTAPTSEPLSLPETLEDRPWLLGHVYSLTGAGGTLADALTVTQA